MTSNIVKYSQVTLAGVASAGLAFATGSTIGIGVGTKFLFEGEPLHAVGSFLFILYNKERDVLNATRLEFSKTDYSIQNIFNAALQ